MNVIFKKGTRQGSISGPYLFNLFINDLDLVNCPDASLSKYADDTMMQVIVNKARSDFAIDVILEYFSWSSTNCMPCNLSNCKELVLKKEGQVNPGPIGNKEILYGLSVYAASMRELNTVHQFLPRCHKCLRTHIYKRFA